MYLFLCLQGYLNVLLSHLANAQAHEDPHLEDQIGETLK